VCANGEVAWSREDAEDAIIALGAAGCLVLGLDFRRDTDEGGVFEVAWSAHDPQGDSPADVVLATEEAIDALRRGLAHDYLADLPWVLISWSDGQG
jgi:hypothetical protein